MTALAGALLLGGGAVAAVAISGSPWWGRAAPAAPTSGSGDRPPAAEPAGTEAADPPASPPAETDASGSQPGSDVADLAAVDWTSLAWTTACTEADTLEEVTLSEPPDGEGITGEDGTLEHHRDPDALAGVVYAVHVGDVVYGDVTGDGHDDAVFRTTCFWGNAFTWSVEVWSHAPDGSPLHLPPVLDLTKFDGQIVDVDVVDDALRISTGEGAEDDSHPHLDGYPVQVVTDWRYEAQRWRSTEVAREDTSAAGTTHVPEVACPARPQEVTAEQAAWCLYEAWMLDDGDLASVYASSGAVDALFERAWEAPGWDWDDCLEQGGAATCWWYEPSADPRYHGAVVEMSLGKDTVGHYVERIDFYG